MEVAVAVGLHLVQWVGAFLTLDLFFRYMPVGAEVLRDRLPVYRRRFTLIGLFACLVVGAAQVGVTSNWGLGLGLLGWVPWWVLWRFGWRKQFTFLYKDDGGKDRS